jgi:hypothetical protein
MPTTSIKISQLDPIASLTSDDFFPIDQSSSIKTYRASLSQLQNLFSTGSFTGSFTGDLNGTSSWAINALNSNTSISGGFSTSSSYALSSSNALTASYALNSSAGDLSGAGTTNYVPIWTGTKTLGSTSDFYAETGYFTSTRDLKIIKNAPSLFVTGSGGGYVAVRAEYNSALMLQSAQSASQDGWMMIVSADGANAAPGVPYDIRGRLDLTTVSASSQFISKQVTGESTPITYVLSTRSNGLYYWPQPGAQSLSRDGTFNIGVDSANPNTDSRLKIQVFSGSSVSNPQTYHIGKAIEVTYGSSSLNTTFCVSSSGATYVGGELTVNGGVKIKSDPYTSITSLGEIVSIDAKNAGTSFIQLQNFGTASITMSQGSQLNVIVNQAYNNGGLWNGNLYFTGSILSGSTYYSCPIVWRLGFQPAITTGTSNHADLFSFIAVNTSTLGPKGSGAPNNTVIYGTALQDIY